MEAEIRPFDHDKDARMVTGWGTKHSFPLPPKEMLPDSGFIVNDAACGFLYTTGSALGWVEWVFSNPQKSKEERSEALDLLFEKIENTATEHGILALFSSSGANGYSNVLERNGFKETDRDVRHYVKMIIRSTE